MTDNDDYQRISVWLVFILNRFSLVCLYGCLVTVEYIPKIIYNKITNQEQEIEEMIRGEDKKQ